MDAHEWLPGDPGAVRDVVAVADPGAVRDVVAVASGDTRAEAVAGWIAVDTAIVALHADVSATMRDGRSRLGLSQRELATASGLSAATVSRLESGREDPRLSWVIAALIAVGARLVVPDAAAPLRCDGEYARDAQGRRLPAHLGPYRLNSPHNWWPGWTQILMWGDSPTWSYRRRSDRHGEERR
jgi:transcriptional regulator with XRE-family HTH domain